MPRWPVFIPSKGRADTRLTVKAFDAIGVPYTVFVEPQELDVYAQHIPRERLHVLPHRDKGVTVTRNYMWDYAARLGVDWYWSFDDNIRRIYRYNRNSIIPAGDGTPLAVMEDFMARYENSAIAGMNYTFFIVRKRKRQTPYILNTRIYSNMLIRTHATERDGRPLRFVTFFNEDTELCLRALKAGWCTVQFQAFLVMKSQTMSLAGGNTPFYERTNGRLEFAEELQRAHPDMVRVGQRWGRWHHFVNFSEFKHPLRRCADVVIPHGVNNFGMVLQERTADGWRTCDDEQTRLARDTMPARIPAPAHEELNGDSHAARHQQQLTLEGV